MTDIIKCDALIFQTLDDLKAACTEAADPGSPVRDFEVGVFCGKYRSPLPADYLERSSRLYKNAKLEPKSMVSTQKKGGSGTAPVSSSGPVNIQVPQEALYPDRTNDFEDHEDIK
jgi:amidophosphoribosyltransferase